MTPSQQGFPAAKEQSSRSIEQKTSSTSISEGKKNNPTMGLKIESLVESYKEAEETGAGRQQSTSSISKATPTTNVPKVPNKIPAEQSPSEQQPQKSSTVAVLPAEALASQPTSRKVQRFSELTSSYELTSTQIPKGGSSGSVPPGILKKSSSTTPRSGPETRQLSQSLPGMTSPKSVSATSSSASLRSASTRALVNVRSRERMFKRIERRGPLLDIYIPSGSQQIQDQTPVSSRETRKVPQDRAEKRKVSSDSIRSRSSRSNRGSQVRKSSSSATEEPGGLRLKELVQNDKVPESLKSNHKVVDIKSNTSPKTVSKSEDKKPVVVPSRNVQSISSRPPMKEETKRKEEDKINQSNFVYQTSERGSSTLHSALKQDTQIPEKTKDNNRESVKNSLSHNIMSRSKVTLDRLKQSFTRLRRETAGERFSSAGTYADASAPDDRRGVRVEKSVSEDAKRRELNNAQVGGNFTAGTAKAETAQNDTLLDGNLKVNKSSSTSLPSQKRIDVASTLVQLSEVPETQSHQGVDTDTAIASSSNRKTSETKNESHWWRGNEGSRRNSEIFSPRRSSERSSSSMSEATNTSRRLSDTGGNIEMRRPSVSRRLSVISKTSVTESKKN